MKAKTTMRVKMKSETEMVSGDEGKDGNCENGRDGSESAMAMSTDNGTVEATRVKMEMVM